MSLKCSLFRRLGYKKMDSKNQIIHTLEAQKRLLTNKTHPVIFDVGANIGQTATQYRNKFPEATIYSFEPVPKAYLTLTKRCQEDPGIKTYQLGMSDRAGEASFNINYRSDASSLLNSAQEGQEWSPRGVLDTIERVKIQTTTLDQFCHKEKLACIDVLKMDAQGSEMLILKGAKQLLTQRAIELIYTEVLFVPLYEGQAYFHDLSVYLAPYGYALFDIFNRRYAPNGRVKWADALYVKQR